MTPQRADRIRARIDAPNQAAHMLTELEARSSGALEDIRADPLRWLEEWPELELILLSADTVVPDDSPRCDVEGGYRSTAPLPRIGVRESSPARMNFTALHELGHHIQRTTPALLDDLGQRDDVGEALEEAACDRFAAEILIPEEVASSVLGTSTPTAAAVIQLWGALPHVSRQAVIIRAARNLETDGHMLLLNGEGGVEICASRGSFRLPRGSDQKSTAIWKAIQTSRGSTSTARTQFSYASGLQAGEMMYAQASPMGNGYTLVVAAVERVPWQLSINKPEWKTYGTWWTCERTSCGESFIASVFCPKCGNAICPTCNYCGCRNVEDFTCTECFLIKSVAELSSTPDVCLECVRPTAAGDRSSVLGG
jgi:hypothetical protein